LWSQKFEATVHLTLVNSNKTSRLGKNPKPKEISWTCLAFRLAPPMGLASIELRTRATVALRTGAHNISAPFGFAWSNTLRAKSQTIGAAKVTYCFAWRANCTRNWKMAANAKMHSSFFGKIKHEFL